MLTGDKISVTQILERLFRISGFTTNFNLNDAVVLVAECIDLIGVPSPHVEKVTNGDINNGHPQPIKITGHKGLLPSDLKEIIQTRTWPDKCPMSYATYTFHSGLHCEGSPDLVGSYMERYSVNPGKIIKTSFREGYVEMAYNSYSVDKHGLPLIPNEERYIKAIEAYLKKQFYLPLWENGKIPDKVFAKAEQEYAWYVGSAHNAALMQGIDQMTNMTNYVVSLIPNLYHSESFFKDLGNPQIRINNNNSAQWNR